MRCSAFCSSKLRQNLLFAIPFVAMAYYVNKSTRNRYSCWILPLQLLLVVVLTIRETVVVSFTAPHPQNCLRNVACHSQLRSQVRLAATPSKSDGAKRKRRKKRTPFDKKKKGGKDDYVHDGIEIWRIYGVSVHPDALVEEKEKAMNESEERIPKALEKTLLGKLRSSIFLRCRCTDRRVFAAFPGVESQIRQIGEAKKC